MAYSNDFNAMVQDAIKRSLDMYSRSPVSKPALAEHSKSAKPATLPSFAAQPQAARTSPPELPELPLQAAQVGQAKHQPAHGASRNIKAASSQAAPSRTQNVNSERNSPKLRNLHNLRNPRNLHGVAPKRNGPAFVPRRIPAPSEHSSSGDDRGHHTLQSEIPSMII